MNFGLPEATLNQIRQCLAGFPEIEKVVVFGSRATGRYRSGSDIDIAIWLNPPGNGSLARIAAALDELPTPYLFDVVDYHGINHEPLRQHIDTFGQVLDFC